MRNVFTLAITALAFSAILTACGGGSSTPTPVVVTTTTSAPVSYSALLRFVGPLSGHAAQIQSDLRSRLSVDPMAIGSTPMPVMIVSNIANGCFGSVCAGTGQQGVVQAIVSPTPSTSPAVAFSLSAPDVTLSPTPTPVSTPVALPTGVVGEAAIASNGTPSVQSSGTVSATIGAPVNTTTQAQVYQYVSIAVDCNAGSGFETQGRNGQAPGWMWNGASWTPTWTITQADIYITGATCDTPYNVNGDAGTLHFPGGGTLLSSDNPFFAVLASQWASTSTSVDGSIELAPNPDGSVNALLIAKTHDGSHVFKVFPNSLGTSGGGVSSFEGAVEVSGSGVDGF